MSRKTNIKVVRVAIHGKLAPSCQWYVISQNRMGSEKLHLCSFCLNSPVHHPTHNTLGPGSILGTASWASDVWGGLSVQTPPNFYKSRILFTQTDTSEALAWQPMALQCRLYLLQGPT